MAIIDKNKLPSGFSKEWDAHYREKSHFSLWPWTDLVSFVMLYARPFGPTMRVLELGCGAGANIPFFLQLGVQYYALDGSPTIIEYLKNKFPIIRNNLITIDFTREIPFSGDFDLIFGAARLNLKIIDIPIRYKERKYGTTNIQRWKHGWLLLKMVLFAMRRIKFV